MLGSLMDPDPRTARPRGFTLIELMVVIGIATVLLTLGVPTFRDYIVTQRLKAATAVLVTDLQYARSEAASRSRRVFVHFKTDNAGPACYTLYIDSTDRDNQCDCRAGPGSACGADTRELRTVVLPTDESVRLALPNAQSQSMSFDPLSGGVYVPPADFVRPLPGPYTVETVVDDPRRLRIQVSLGGTPAVCRPTGSTLTGGYPAC